MTPQRSSPDSDIGDAAWAYNRWPTIGLYVGAGVGLAVAVLVRAGWLWIIGSMVVGAVTGCLIGVGLAKLAFPGASRGYDSNEADDA